MKLTKLTKMTMIVSIKTIRGPNRRGNLLPEKPIVRFKKQKRGKAEEVEKFSVLSDNVPSYVEEASLFCTRV